MELHQPRPSAAHMKDLGPGLPTCRPDITTETVDKFLTRMYQTHSAFVFCGHARARAQSPDVRIDPAG
jgi:hypothetical protein